MTTNPAPFSLPILEEMAGIVNDYRIASGKRKIRLLDPFAGSGRIHRLATPQIVTVGVELEPEWAEEHPSTEVGNALHLRFRKNSFDVIGTSCTYGNRMADHHVAKDGSERRSYRHNLGRMPSTDSSAILHWGTEYRKFHRAAWREADRVLRPGGLFVLNIANHWKTEVKGEDPVEQRVSEWHLTFFLNDLRYGLVEVKRVKTKKFTKGANRHRTDGELIIVMRKT